MKVKFYLDKRPSKNSCAIHCYVREFNNTLKLNTGQSIQSDLWDASTYRANPRKTRDNITKGSLKSLNQYLNIFESKILDIERIIRSKQPDAGFNAVADAIKRQFDKKKVGLFDIYDEFLKIKRQEVSKQAIFKFKRVKTLLEDYQKSYRDALTFEKITPLFFSKFFSFLIENKNMLNNTANKNIQFLKTFLIWANNNGYTDNSSYKFFKSKSEVNEVIYLT